MISYLVGNPGSGKTYYAVFKIYQLFLFQPKKTFLSKFVEPEKQKTYAYCYTNINEFKFDLSPKFIKFDFERFYSDMEILHALYLSKATDEEINEQAKLLKLHNVIIVLDECHNFLKDKENPVLVWWLTYHRHLYQDIMLITQDLTLVNNEYKRIAEHFIKAVDSSKRLFKNKFRYMLYGSYKMFQKDIMQKFHVPYLQEVFNLYHSGQNSSQKSFVRKFLFVSLFLFIVLLIYFYFFIESFKPETNPNSNLSEQNFKTYQPAPQKPVKETPALVPQIYTYIIRCIDDNCHFKDDHSLFPYGFISHTIISSKPVYFYSNSKGKDGHLVEYFLVFDAPVLDAFKQNLKKDVSNEKENSTTLSPPSIF